MRLNNKTAIVTGGASGFGKGIVEKFIKEGANVVIADINYDLAKELEDSIGTNAFAVKVDVSKKNDVDNMIKRSVEHFSEVNILIQNAAIGMKPQPLLETSEELFDKLFAINVKSVFLGAILWRVSARRFRCQVRASATVLVRLILSRIVLLQ